MATPPPHAALILASGSVYRKELLARLGLVFDCRTPDIDESALPGESFRDTAVRLAKEKAVVIARAFPHAVVIGSDQVAVCEDQRLDKPGHAQAALSQLMLQRGKQSEFHTAVCVAWSGGTQTAGELVTTRVTFKSAQELSDERLRAYVAIEKPFDCAGSAKSEGLGIALIESFEGPDPTALIGLPLIALTRLLGRAGIDPLTGSTSAALS